jgi:hypothetical protein
MSCISSYHQNNSCVEFWDSYYTIIHYTHCQEQMKSVGSHGSSSMSFVMKVMVRYVVSDS